MSDRVVIILLGAVMLAPLPTMWFYEWREERRRNRPEYRAYMEQRRKEWEQYRRGEWKP